MSTYSVLDARNNLSRLIADAQSGLEVVITNRGVPVAQITSVASVDAPLTGAALAEWIEAHPLPARLVRSAAEIDAQIAEAREGWE
ncbi:type II toxin-antitoxin system Phd/YefM family antitoxin [Microbacterium sp. SD291]|uniref:type II toxin-antitoxin system Phd/YefM family antitoxin n=1 Tax=Microbacterium sp. SD291 TaxID=2782007 RepID=UPI001A96EC6D|nr:type II toxin-antitoxin system prevent-host-death family antitoxin [Microbacterium sp. SD291]MBO0981254.1 type II toxin-antitoxin system prevent-host-death family antitoxin [Microbacterium sp. SD291]